MVDVKKLVEVINKEGRQGPKDLKSKEVFSWVHKQMDLTYSEYINILEENSIPESERKTNRNAFFIKEENGRFQLLKSKEEEIRKYICYIVRENPGITSSETREKFKIIYQDYTLIDLMDQKNLTSNQDIIDQTIRNILVSNYFKKLNNILFYRSEEKPFKYTLKKPGFILAAEVENLLNKNKIFEKYLEEELDVNTNINITKGIGFYTEEELQQKYEQNKKYNFYDMFDAKTYQKGRIPTDSKLKATAFFRSKYKCEVNSNHITFPTNYYPNYLEGHHLIPISAQKNFASINLDCIENLVSLCPICHSQIHYGTKEAKKEIFETIIKSREADLARIGFTEPILKVIFETYY